MLLARKMMWPKLAGYDFEMHNGNTALLSLIDSTVLPNFIELNKNHLTFSKLIMPIWKINSKNF